MASSEEINSVRSRGITPVQLVDASGNPISSSSGGAAATAQGPDANGAAPAGNPVVSAGITSAGVIARDLDAANALNSTGAGIKAVSLVAQLDDTAPTAITENQFGNVRMSPNRGLLVRPDASEADFWSYPAAASGIVNTTTAVTIKAAAGAGIRNYLKSLQVEAATLGGATELVIRDGAAGTVIWRTQLQTVALPLTTINFDPPLRGTANTLMEAATLTAVTGGIYLNAQGYAGA
jgi:hypothetical protein